MSHPPSIPKPIPKKQMQFPGCLLDTDKIVAKLLESVSEPSERDY